MEKHLLTLLLTATANCLLFSQVPIPDMAFTGVQYWSSLGNAVANAGDVNGDGYDDLLIGHYLYDNGHTNEGRALIYHGSAAGVSATPNAIVESDHTNAYLGYSVSTAGDVNGDGYDDILVGAYNLANPDAHEGGVYIYHGGPSGINTSPAIILESNQTNAYFGKSVSSADVNGDGYTDIIVGSYTYSNGQTSEGRIFIYHGSPVGITATPALTIESNQELAHFGNAVSGAGDLNNDGYDDIVVGADLYDNGEYNEGKVFVYHGSATGINPVAVVTMDINYVSGYFGFSVSGAGDINNDGYDDLLIGTYKAAGKTYVYHGSAAGVSAIPNAILSCDQTSAQFGWDVSDAGDVNNDGFDDIIVGASYYNNNGRAFLFHGSATGINASPAATYDGEDDDDAAFGSAVSGAGDLNGDGYDDLIVGSYLYDGTTADEGKAYLYYGSNCVNSVFYADHDEDGYGNPNATVLTCTLPAGYLTDSSDCYDLNALQNPETVWYMDMDEDHYYAGDGSPIMQCTQPAEGYDYSGILGTGDCLDLNVAVYPGAPEHVDGLDNDCNGNIDEGLDWSFGGLLQSFEASSDYGYAVSDAGDVNADGFDDIIIGAYRMDNGETDEGVAYIFHGSATGIDPTPSTILECNQATAYFGVSVSGAGDVNNDGYDDVVVGAMFYDNGQTDEGRVFIYHGSATGINTTPVSMMEVNQASAEFGSSVSSAGDVNNDGYADIIVGASQYDNGQTDEGRAYVFHGSATGINTTPVTIVESNQAVARFGLGVSGAGDINGDGYDDVIIGAHRYDNGQTDEGRVFIYHGSAAGISLTPAATLESNQSVAYFGFGLSKAGDVNGDGYADIIVGAREYNNVESNEGGAFVYHGSATGIVTTPAVILESNQTSALFGWSVSNAGDVNNDGFDDVIVGAQQYENEQYNEGGAYLYLGSPTGIDPSPSEIFEADKQVSMYGTSVSGAGDINGDGSDDVLAGAYFYDTTPLNANEGAVFIYISCANTYYPDTDGDGYGEETGTINTCAMPPGFTTVAGDCDDDNAFISPDAIEICNTLDDDCNSLIDDGITETVSIAAGGATTFCQGGSVLLTATYSGVTVKWKKNGSNIPGATAATYTATSKGTYTCQTTSACDTEISSGIFVNVQKNPTASITAGGATTFCAGGSVVLTANAGAGLSYQWYKGATPLAGATLINYTATTAGTYKCRVTKTATGCFKNSNAIIVTVPCRENETITNNQITNNSFVIYPNPNEGIFTITGNGSPLERGRPTRPDQSDGGVSIEIYNTIGQLIYAKQLPGNEINETIELYNMTKGMYVVRIQSSESISEQKLIIE